MSDNIQRQRIGVFGGTFDPIHLGHLLMAEFVREQLELTEMRFIPAAIAPHKQDTPATQAKHRLEMIQLAISGNPFFIADDRELRRGGTSYTVETLQQMRLEFENSEINLLIGADSLNELHTWRDPQRICQLAFVVVVPRGGQPAPDLRLLKRYLPQEDDDSIAKHVVAVPQIEISSSDIRARVAQNRSLRYQLHPAVAAYIAANDLYH